MRRNSTIGATDQPSDGRPAAHVRIPLTPDHDDNDPTDRARGADLADAGLADYCAAIVTNTDGCEHLALLRYDLGADYLPTDWSVTALHELVGHLPQGDGAGSPARSR